jgi:hypothetical protein
VIQEVQLRGRKESISVVDLDHIVRIECLDHGQSISKYCVCVGVGQLTISSKCCLIILQQKMSAKQKEMQSSDKDTDSS